MTNDIARQASALIARDAETVFRFMSDPNRLHLWSFGTWETALRPDGLVQGTSIFDGAQTLVRIDADAARLAIDYHLGATPDALVPRIHARVVPGPVLGGNSASSVLTLLAWRAAAMSDDRWHRLVVSHEFEVVLIKNLIENERA